MSKMRLSHDEFFKKAFSDIDVARSFLQNFLPEKVVALLQLTELELTNQSFVTPQLKPYFSDLVYLCKTKEEQVIEVALLFEHKSNLPKYPHIQLLRYQLEYWENQIKQKKALTPMIPIVVYQGKRKWKPWPFHRYFGSLNPILQAYIPGFEYLLTAIHQIKDGEILVLEAEWLNEVLFLMKYIRDHPHQHFASIFLSIAPQIDDPAKKNLFLAMVVYFLQNAEISRQEFNQLAMTLSGEPKKIAMSTYDQLIEEGIIQGIEKGIEQGLEQGIERGIEQGVEQNNKLVIQNGLNLGLSIDVLCELTDLPTEEVQTIIQILKEEKEQ